MNCGNWNGLAQTALEREFQRVVSQAATGYCDGGLSRLRRCFFRLPDHLNRLSERAAFFTQVAENVEKGLQLAWFLDGLRCLRPVGVNLHQGAGSQELEFLVWIIEHDSHQVLDGIAGVLVQPHQGTDGLFAHISIVVLQGLPKIWDGCRNLVDLAVLKGLDRYPTNARGWTIDCFTHDLNGL